jgi:hypothetical protein
MHLSSPSRPAPLWLIALALFALLAPVSAQTAPPALEAEITKDWHQANNGVSQFKRGHADVLKWELANEKQTAKPAGPSPIFKILSPQAAVQLAWQAHPELAGPLAHLGPVNRERIAQGHLFEVAPALRLQVEDYDALIDVAADARKAWLNAVAAHLVLKQQLELQDAAQASAELAKRMAQVGNWSRMEQAQWQAQWVGVRRQTLKAQLEARQSQTTLLKLTQRWGFDAEIGLPDALPEMPDKALTSQAIQRRLSELRPLLPRAESLNAAIKSEQAFQAYQASFEATQLARQTVGLQGFINEEVVLRYNGMLLSVWDLLKQTTNLMQARINAINAQRDFLIATADLQLVLQGGTPTRFVSLDDTQGESATVH